MSTCASDTVSDRRDALKDDFKIVAAASNAHVNGIAHNDPSIMARFLARAKKQFEQCRDLNSILLKEGFDGIKARQLLGLAIESM